MSPDPPGAPPSGPGVGGPPAEERPRFGHGAEPATGPTTSVSTAPGAGRRRFLDDPDEPPRAPRKPKVRARKVQRILRHIDPWSVLKVSLLFFVSVFLIICVASALLWSTARSAGTVDSVERFITSLGFGNCEDISPDDPAASTTTSSTIDGTADQLGGGATGSSTTVPPVVVEDDTSNVPDDSGKCREGQRLVGGFKFQDEKIFLAFALGGVVLVLAGATTTVVMVLLFNLISDLLGGVRITVLKEEPVARTGSPRPGGRD